MSGVLGGKGQLADRHTGRSPCDGTERGAPQRSQALDVGARPGPDSPAAAEQQPHPHGWPREQGMMHIGRRRPGGKRRPRDTHTGEQTPLLLAISPLLPFTARPGTWV